MPMQRHLPTLPVPMDVAAPIRWAVHDADATRVVGVPEDLGCHYVVEFVGLGWRASRLDPCPGSTQPCVVTLGNRTTRDECMALCQRCEHASAWLVLPRIAQDMLTELARLEAL